MSPNKGRSLWDGTFCYDRIYDKCEYLQQIVAAGVTYVIKSLLNSLFEIFVKQKSSSIVQYASSGSEETNLQIFYSSTKKAKHCLGKGGLDFVGNTK